MKKITVASAFLLALLCFGCGSKNNDPQPNADQNPEPTEDSNPTIVLIGFDENTIFMKPCDFRVSFKVSDDKLVKNVVASVKWHGKLKSVPTVYSFENFTVPINAREATKTDVLFESIAWNVKNGNYELKLTAYDDQDQSTTITQIFKIN